jgi:hypothetical protein
MVLIPASVGGGIALGLRVPARFSFFSTQWCTPSLAPQVRPMLISDEGRNLPPKV